MIAPEARMRIWLKKNDVCMNKQMPSRNSENLEATNNMSARTNRIVATARLDFGSNEDTRKRKSGRVQPIDSRNRENLEAMKSMSASRNRIANVRLKFDSTS